MEKKKTIISSLISEWSLFVKPWVSFTKRCIVPSLITIGPVVLEKKIFNFVNVSLPFRNCLPLEKGVALHLNKLEYPSPKDALCQVWLKLALWFLRRRFFNFVNVFSLFRNYLPLGKGMVLHLNKLESSPLKDALCQVWLKSAQQFLRRRWKCETFTDRQTARQTDRQMTDKKWSEKLPEFQLRWAKIIQAYPKKKLLIYCKPKRYPVPSTQCNIINQKSVPLRVR